ncbi:SusC/RagA family TonB-linked outer membrane protein [Taibaiella sp. KBW10]|uniref:SusC/RagA family TonB-linked outer membrane protein n=1 Tax=Taibaiella sp. KBW10 TaxID=2153357 RepID=UPI000F590814|nr:SusC/RagA family TonB-linked outer membrane protein [Taibaiella sp. KBW10]RQO32010.1 SusC/RagA family TonB-linked outer membrane protein [Taibaiella sp. KBW10]
MKKLLLPIALIAMTSVSAFAQSRVVKGRVLDESGEAVLGASVIIKGTQSGTVTDDEGNFTITVPEGSNTLVVSSLGLGSQEVAAGNGTQAVTVSFKNQGGKELQGVIVTALGIKRSEKSLGYATQQVSKEQLENARANNVVDALAGKVAGVRVNGQSGGVGGSSKIIIRGASSFSGSSQPLFVIDGVPISNSGQGGTGNAEGVGVDYGNRASDINPDDIETMTVLKGPAATAQYGSLAKDGAIIITTKRGSKNAGLSISVNSSYRVEKVLIKPELQTDYAQGNYGVYNLRFANGWGPKISDMANTPVTDYLGRTVTLQAHPDNIDNFFQTGSTAINDIAVSGGNDKSDYRIGFGALNSKGIVLNQELNRYNLSANVGHKFNDKFSSRFTLMYTNSNSNGRPVQSSNNPNVLGSSIYSIPITVDVNDLKQNYQNEFGVQNNLTTDKTGNNPFWILNKNKNGNKLNRFMGSANLEYKATDWLTIANTFGFDAYEENRLGYVRAGTAGDIKGSYLTSDIFNKRFNNDFIVTAQKQINKDWNLRAMAGVNLLDRRIDQSFVTGSNFLLDEGEGVFRPGNVETAIADRAYSGSRLIGLYGELSASYKDYLYLSVTGRNDWSSALVYTGNYSYFYPSVSGSFVFSELMNSNKVLSYGKLRASWAKVGSDTDPYSTLLTYSPLTTFFTQFSLPASFPFLGRGAFALPRILPNETLKPQLATSREIGADLRFFGNLIGLDVTYYNTETKNQIMDITVPASTGYFVKQINAGSITNKGLEAMLRVSPFSNNRNGFQWDFVANFSHNKQVVNELDGILQEYAVQSGWSGLQVKAPVGGSFAIYGSKWKRSPDGAIVINKNTGLREVVQNQFIGKVNPDFMLGISNKFSYKGVSLGFLVDIRQGGVFYSGTVAALRSSGMAKETMANRDATFTDKGVNDNGDGTYSPNTTPVQSMQDFWGTYSSTSNTEGNVFDASFVKLREVTLSYAFPESFRPFKKAVKGLEIGFEGRNLWLIKSFVPHVDPEMSYFGSGSAGDGVEFNSFPATATYGINLKVKF